MSVEGAVARINELQSALAPQPPVPPAPPTAATGQTNFASLLQAAGGAPAGSVAPTGGVGAAGGGVGARLLAAVQGEVGQTEQPPGSNDSSRIAEYRSATRGAPGPGPWCAYFVSWAAKQAGAPVGNSGEGFGSVDALYSWAQSAGKAVPAGSGRPQAGDLVVWDEHIGVVERVLPDGRVQTIEGNSSDSVARRTYGADAGGALGYVRLG